MIHLELLPTTKYDTTLCVDSGQARVTGFSFLGYNSSHAKEKQPTFADRVYALIEKMPDGVITTYGQIARKIGAPRAARAVGTALKNYPRWEGGNCYRVVNANGKVGAYCGEGEGTEKQKIKIEKLKNLGCLIDEKISIMNFWEMLW
ncbi:MGMT family protein [Candidatus Gracilibacteria bacterium]|nr:MGMT family protein [Candidatus Gracilibacteria bacterium]